MKRWTGACVSVAVMAITLDACAAPPGDIRENGMSPIAATSVGPTPGEGPDLTGPANPFTDDRGAAGAGRRLFRQFNCSGCHGEHAGGGMGPSLRDVDWLYGDADAQIYSSISQGRAHGMPSWQTRLEPDQIWRLVTYIKSMRTRNEPEPPTE